MTKKGREFNEIFDLTAMRVIVGSVKDCYGAIGVIHSLWKPLPGRFKDFVAMPKANMYQALHTTVIGPEGKPLEIQIRTGEMHNLAEYGVAAHVAYKEGGATGDPQREKMTWLRQLVEAQGDQDPTEFLESLKVDLFEDEVFVFTPEGRGQEPLRGLDAARLRLRRPHRRRPPLRRRQGQRQHRPAPLPAALGRHRRSPDREAEARPVARLAEAGPHEPGPQQDPRLLQRGTARGRREARPRSARGDAPQARHADAEGRDLAAARGRDPRDGLPQGDRLLHRPRPGQDLDQGGRQEGDAAARRSARRSRSTSRSGARATDDKARRTKEASNYGIRVKGADQVAVRLAKCCRPVPGDEIAGYVSLGRGITIHRTDCKNLKALKRAPERFVEVSWNGENEASYRVQLQIDAYDRTRLLEDLSRTFSEAGINIIEASCMTRHPMVKNTFVIEVGDPEQLKQCLSRLRNVESVFDAYRITPTS